MKKLLLLAAISVGCVSAGFASSSNEKKPELSYNLKKQNVMKNLEGLGFTEDAYTVNEGDEGHVYKEGSDPSYSVKFDNTKEAITATADFNGKSYDLTEQVYFNQSMFTFGNVAKGAICVAAAGGAYCYFNHPDKFEGMQKATMDYAQKTAKPAAQGFLNSASNWIANTWKNLFE